MLAYLSGPMTGYPEYNYAAFNAAAARLRQLGMDVINPAETAGGIKHLDRKTFMSIDIGYVEACDCVVVIDGWEKSRGALLEVQIAIALNQPIFKFDPVLGVNCRVYMTGIEMQTIQTTDEEERAGFDINAFLAANKPPPAPNNALDDEPSVIVLFDDPSETVQ